MAGGLGRRLMTLGQLQALRMLLPLDASVVVALLHVALVAALVCWARSRRRLS